MRILFDQAHPHPYASIWPTTLSIPPSSEEGGRHGGHSPRRAPGDRTQCALRGAHRRTGARAERVRGSGGVPGVRDDATATTPAQILQTKKFAIDQPVVLGQIGVHHAYARGLTGDETRIGIDDDFVDFTQRDEFEGRVEREASGGARLADNGGTRDSEIREQIETCRKRVTCAQWIDTVTLGTKYDISLEYARDWMLVRYDSDGENDIENAIVEELVGLGLHEYLISEHILLCDRHRSMTCDAIGEETIIDEETINEARAWATAPNPYIATHGTAVASVAAGTRLGVAPGARIVPTTRNLSGYDWLAPGIVPFEERTAIEEMDAATRQATDMRLAEEQQEIYRNADVINRSWGPLLSTRAITAGEIGEQQRWYEENLPALLRTHLQKDTPLRDRTIVVYAAGNSGHRGQDRPHGMAQLPYHVEELRGHTLAVGGDRSRDETNCRLFQRVRAAAQWLEPCGRRTALLPRRPGNDAGPGAGSDGRPDTE